MLFIIVNGFLPAALKRERLILHLSKLKLPQKWTVEFSDGAGHDQETCKHGQFHLPVQDTPHNGQV